MSYGVFRRYPYSVTQAALNVGLFPAVSAALTGTIITGGVLESEIKAGGETLVITLTGDTFKAAGTGPIGSLLDTQALIDGNTSAQVEATGWNAEVRDKEPTTIVVRDSTTQATLTFTTAAAAYAITASETITVTIPVDVLDTGAAPVVATPTFVVTNESGVVVPLNSLMMMGLGR